MKAETVGEDLRVSGNVFQRVAPKTLNDPSPVRLLLFGMERRVTSRLDRRASLDGTWVAMQSFR